MADYKTDEASWWCPGCGDFGVLAALQKAVLELGVAPEELAIVAGIGCSGKIGNYINSYNIHTTHGRTMPVALGVKLANRELTVIAAGGDGDGFAIGMGHFVHALRRNPDITYVVMDNQIYGLTKGQVSPTSMEGFETRSTPSGSIEHPIRPLQMAMMADYDRSDRSKAIATLMEYNELVTGIAYHNKDSAPFEDRLPGFRQQGLANQSLELNEAEFDRQVAMYR
ncbi:MAG: hypothetical protein HYX51_05870 [Chloroflexi bacterium]|nr:hypothetical protein [Chloroflexota bacterium]